MAPLTPSEYFSDFERHPCYQALLNSPTVTPQPTASRSPPSPNPLHVHTLYSSTLFNSTGLRAIQSFHAKGSTSSKAPCSPQPSVAHPTREEHEIHSINSDAVHPSIDAFSDEWLVLVSLGTGLNGLGGIVHGGIAMTLLDSAMAVRATRAVAGQPVLTTTYHATFKNKIKAPCVVLCRAWLEREASDITDEENGGVDADGGAKDERLIRTRGTVEDGMGKIYLTATAQFVKRNGRPKATL